MVMRFRTEDFDVAMPDPLIRYWTAWNESDLDRLAGHLHHAVTRDVVWNDPRDSFQGLDALAGLDVVTLCATTGLIERVDGFFGEPSPVLDVDSGIPAALRGPAADLGT